MLKEYVNVALFARAWIEITKVITPGLMSIVALFARAWIEIKFDGFS